MTLSEYMTIPNEVFVFLIIIFIGQLIYGRVYLYLEDRVRPILTMPVAVLCSLSFSLSMIYLYIN